MLRIIPIVRWVAAISLSVSVTIGGVGCGGGGGSSRGGSTGTGEVAVLLADAPSDEYDQILADVAEISLLPADGSTPVVLFEADPPLEIDFLALRDEDLVLTVRDDIPAGTYSKIRLRIPDVRPIGGPCEDLNTRLPSGKVDLKPRSPIVIRPGETLFLRLDLDVDKSLHLHPAGNSGQCNFRPVVHIEAETEEPRDRCPRIVTGEVLSVDPEDDDSVDLDDPEDRIATVRVALPDDRGDLEVRVDVGTVIFDESGDLAGIEAIDPGDTIRVRGRLEDDAQLRASLIAMGDVIVLEGEALGPVVGGRFPLRPDAGQIVVSELDVQIAPETVVTSGCDTPLDPSNISAGDRIRAAGKIDVADRALLAFLVVARAPSITSVEIEAARSVDEGIELDIVERTESGDRRYSVLAPDGVTIRLEGDGPVPLDLLDELLACRTLPVRIVLDPEDESRASSVVILVERLDGRVAEVDLDGRIVTLATRSRVAVLDDATIIDLRSEENNVGDLDDLEPGTPVRIFGLSSCDGDDPSFWGFIVLSLMAPTDPEPECDIGEFAARGHGGWGTSCSGNNGGCYRDEWFPVAFPDGLLIGCEDGDSALFTSSDAIETFLPNGGRSGPLGGDFVDPEELEAGTFAGHTVALTLNIGFDDADDAFRSGVYRLGELVVGDSLSPCYGLSVDEVLVEANAALGGCSSPYGLSLRAAKDCVSGVLDAVEAGGGSGSLLVCPTEAPVYTSRTSDSSSSGSSSDDASAN